MFSKITTIITFSAFIGLALTLPVPTPAISLNSIRVGNVEPTSLPNIPDKDTPPPTLTPEGTTTVTNTQLCITGSGPNDY